MTALAAATVVMTGCRGTARVSADTARLRGEIVQLQDRLVALERRNRELESQLQAAAAGSQSTVSEEIRAAVPHVTEIAIERLSFAHDTDGDGKIDTLTLYVAPRDGRGRFTQLVGELSASALVLPVQGEPRVIGRVLLSPLQVRDAYRSAFTGTHYTIDVPLDFDGNQSGSISEREIFARVQYQDGLTGETFTAERKIALP